MIVPDKRKNKHKPKTSATVESTLLRLLTLNDDTGNTLDPVRILFQIYDTCIGFGSTHNAMINSRQNKHLIQLKNISKLKPIQREAYCRHMNTFTS